MDDSHFWRLMELRNSGRVEDHIRESEMLLATEPLDSNERASLLTAEHVSYCMLGRLAEAREVLQRIKQIDISDPETRLNAEFCEPCLLTLEGRNEEGILGFAAFLERNAQALQDPGLRYLYEDVQFRRAWALFGLGRYPEAFPILEEAGAFSFENPGDEQNMHYALGVCYEETRNTEAAKKEYLRAIGLNTSGQYEEEARYRFARLAAMAGGFAQARTQLEAIVRGYADRPSVVSQEYVFELLSQVCGRLGDEKDAKRYADLAARTRDGRVRR